MIWWELGHLSLRSALHRVAVTPNEVQDLRALFAWEYQA